MVCSRGGAECVNASPLNCGLVRDRGGMEQMSSRVVR